jgi:hypothetical protein
LIAKIRESSRFTISELHEYFPIVSRRLNQEIVMDWLKGLEAAFFDEGLQKLIHDNKCLNLYIGYGEK